MGEFPDFVKLAEAYGATGMRLTDKTTLVEDMQARRSRPTGPVRRRRARHARGEHVPDDPRRPGRAGHGGLSAMGEPGTKELLSLEELEAAGEPAHGAQAHPVDPRGEQAGRADAHRRPVRAARRSTSTRSPSARPTTSTISRITLTLDGALHPIDQVTKQLHKLVNVLKIRDLEPEETVARELALFKVAADGAQRAEVMQIVRDLPRQGRRRHQALDRRRDDRHATTRSRRSRRWCGRSG